MHDPLTCLHGYLENTLGHTKHLGTLVSELFELAKLEANVVQLQPEPFPIAELLQDVVQKYELAAKQNHIELQTRFAPEPPYISADIGLIERVLENLLSNAVRHTPAQGLIVLEITPQAQLVTISVQDTGHGIAPEDLPHVFDRFYRGKRQSRDANHVGLGLAIAKGIVELDNSPLQVTSRLHAGTCFAFQLPLWHPG